MRTVILIQGQERSHQERAADKKQGLERVGVMIEGTIELSGIEECYNKLPPLFKDQQKFKCFSISGDDVNLTPENVITLLQEAKLTIKFGDEKPLVIVMAHGIAAKTSDPEIIPHILALEQNPKQIFFTASLFKMINDYIEQPVELMLISCQSGSAKKYVHLLPQASILVAFSNDLTDVTTSVISRGIDYLNTQEMSDISAITILHGCFLGRQDEEDGCTKASISTSGKKLISFADFISSYKPYLQALFTDQNSIITSADPHKTSEMDLFALLLLYIQEPTQDIDRECLGDLLKEFIYASNMGESQKAKTLPYLTLLQQNTKVDLSRESAALSIPESASAAPEIILPENPEAKLDDYGPKTPFDVDDFMPLTGESPSASATAVILVDVPDQ